MLLSFTATSWQLAVKVRNIDVSGSNPIFVIINL
jgi:hypothetical protein